MAIIDNQEGVFISNVINSKYDIDNPEYNTFPTHYDQNGYGGFMAIDSSISELNTISSLTGKYEKIIPLQRRKLGMMIYDVNPAQETFYQCTDVTACSWEEVDFRFRYFYGPTAPTVTDLQVGEKWFDTIVGSEYTYLPIAEGSSEKAWVDIDHIGEGETFSGYLTLALANTYYVNVGGDEITGSLTADKIFRGSTDEEFADDELVTKSFVEDNFSQSKGGIFSGPLTGTSALFTQSVTADKFYAISSSISDPQQLATKRYVDNSTISGIDFHKDTEGTPFATNVDAISISGGSNITVEFDQSTNPNRYVISSDIPRTQNKNGAHAYYNFMKISGSTADYNFNTLAPVNGVEDSWYGEADFDSTATYSYSLNSGSDGDTITRYKKQVFVESVGFNKPWRVLVKRSFYRANDGSGSSNFIPPLKYTQSALASNANHVNDFFVETDEDLTIEAQSFKYARSTTPGGNGATGSIDWFNDGITYGLGTADAHLGSSSTLTKVAKIATHTVGAFDVLPGDTYITEVFIHPHRD